MAYNGFPATYQPMYYPQQYQPQMPQQPAQQQQQNNIIWVSGEAGAKAFLIAPNTTVQLWDSDDQVIYLKSADASGMPSMKILDYTIRSQTPVNATVSGSAAQGISGPAYATKADVEALAGQIDTLRAELDGLTTKRSAKKEAAANE